MTLKEKLDLLQAEVVSYRKAFEALGNVYEAIEAGLYGPVDERAREAVREELDSLRNVALRYDVLLKRSPAALKGTTGGERFNS